MMLQWRVGRIERVRCCVCIKGCIYIQLFTCITNRAVCFIRRPCLNGLFLETTLRVIAYLLDNGICHIKEVSSNKRAKEFMRNIFLFRKASLIFQEEKNANSSFGFFCKSMGFCHDVSVTGQTSAQSKEC